MGGDNKRRRVGLKKSLRVVPNDKQTQGRIREESSTKSTADAKSSAPAASAQPIYSESMEYFEQLLEQLWTRLDRMEPTHNSGRNPKIPTTWHTQLIQWMLNFPRDAGVKNSTIAVAVVFLQKFLTHQEVSKEWLQLLATVCTFVASKLHETRSRNCVNMRFLTQFVINRRYNANDIKRLERELLRALQWNLHPVTAHALTLVMLELHPDKSERAKITQVANVLLDMQLCDKDFLKWSTKTVALGCFSAACTITGYTEVHKKILARISRFVDSGSVAESEKLSNTLRRGFYVIFPEREHSEKRSSSPTTIMDPIAGNS